MSFTFWGIMKESLSLLWRGEDWMETTIGLIMWLCVTFLSAVMIFFLFWAADSWFRSPKEGVGVVIGRAYSPETTTYSTVYVGSVPIMTPVTYAETFYLNIAIEGQEVSVGVSQGAYNWPEGTMVNCVYHTGRISGEIYIDNMGLKPQ